MNVINWILLFRPHCTDFVRMYICPYSYKLIDLNLNLNWMVPAILLSSLGSCGICSASQHWGTSFWCTQAEGLDDCHDLPHMGRSLSYLPSCVSPVPHHFLLSPEPEEVLCPLLASSLSPDRLITAA